MSTLVPEVIIPFLPGCSYRERNRKHIHSLWESLGYKVIYGECKGIWRKGEAVLDGLKKSSAKVVIIADADVWAPNIQTLIHDDVKVVKPGKMVFRLTEDATIRFINGVVENFEEEEFSEPPLEQVLGGGMIVVNREIALEYPMDRRFYGWGKQDISWGYLLKSIVGEEVGDLNMVHLWHPPQERRGRFLSNEDNEKLFSRYIKARKDKEKMLEILKELK